MDLKQLVTKKEFYISNRKEFISCELRPVWRIALLTLIISIAGRGNKASRNKIHLINWALKKAEHVDSYINYIQKNTNKRPFINLDPAMDKAIDYALYSKLVIVENNRVTLTEDGARLAKQLVKLNAFELEKATFARMKTDLTEDKVKKAFEGK